MGFMIKIISEKRKGKANKKHGMQSDTESKIHI